MSESIAQPSDEASARYTGTQANAETECQVLIVLILGSDSIDHVGQLVLDLDVEVVLEAVLCFKDEEEAVVVWDGIDLKLVLDDGAELVWDVVDLELVLDDEVELVWDVVDLGLVLDDEVELVWDVVDLGLVLDDEVELVWDIVDLELVLDDEVELVWDVVDLGLVLDDEVELVWDIVDLELVLDDEVELFWDVVDLGLVLDDEVELVLDVKEEDGVLEVDLEPVCEDEDELVVDLDGELVFEAVLVVELVLVVEPVLVVMDELILSGELMVPDELMLLDDLVMPVLASDDEAEVAEEDESPVEDVADNEEEVTGASTEVEPGIIDELDRVVVVAFECGDEIEEVGPDDHANDREEVEGIVDIEDVGKDECPGNNVFENQEWRGGSVKSGREDDIVVFCPVLVFVVGGIP
ncbi:hypothetical protein diail_7908 [Diaporthe ilicicola]|nr:hypothetical protein diail_7908 [Diaporthe ilicicola]